ncbi:unnamed protein product [Rotaria sp. Silwood1]|nr:unnamed protein product [Rotaria sp. Silwood1]
MYIFKQPFIGEKVTPHRDATYVFNEPLKVDGIWIALEDATIENGCLWMIPGSHAKPSQRRLIRNPNEQEFNEGKALIFIGEEEQYDNNAFVPVEVKAGRIIEYCYIVYFANKNLFSGDAILIHSQVVHKSEQNFSQLPGQAHECELAYVRAPRDEDDRQDAKNAKCFCLIQSSQRILSFRLK